MESDIRARAPRWALAIAFGCLGGPASAQDTTPPPGEGPAIKVALEAEETFEISAEQRQRLEKYLPNALGRLERRAPVHLVSIGDSVTRYVSHDEHEGDTLLAYEGVFASELAKLFFYTGGIRVIQPLDGQPEKADPAAGPEITLENMGLGGRIALHSLARTTTDAFANKPSLLTIEYGINDVFAQEPLRDYLRAYAESARLARAQGCDPIFLGPTTILGEPDELATMAHTLRYSSALKELAANMGVFYFDLASVTTRAGGAEPSATDAEVIAAYHANLAESYHTHNNGNIDVLHPSQSAQRQLGEAIYKALLAEPEQTYRLGGLVTLDGAGGFKFDFKLKNLGEEDVDGRLFLPPFDGFAPDKAAIPFQLKAGKGQNFTVTYRTTDGTQAYRLSGSEPVLRIPALLVDETQSFAVSVAAPIGPLVPVWEFGAADGLRQSASASFNVVTPDGSAATGAFSVGWVGEGATGSYRSGEPATFSLPLPGGGALRKIGALKLDLEHGGKTYSFLRGLEVSRNLTLGQAVPMARADRYREGGGSARSDVTFRASADQAKLTLVHEIATPLRKVGGKAAPYYLEIQIDARPYGKRRNFGFTDFVRLTPQPDGGVKTSQLRPAVFGNGYAKKLDRTGIAVGREPLPGGGERLRVEIPRPYFYLHEWALGNGNSTLGINTRIFVQNDNSTVDAPFHPDGSYLLVNPGMTRHNAQALGVLELSERPSKRWSSRLY